MGEPTGLGPLEVAAIRAVDRVSGRGSTFVRSADVLDRLEDDGFGPAYLYPVLQDLAVPWQRHLPLLEFQGNFGSPGDDPAADPQYTEVRLSAIGRLALRSEDGALGPVPLGLIDGTAAGGGRVPPFSPRRVVDALRLLTTGRDRTDAELLAAVGAPAVPSGAVITGDLARLLAGERTTMTMSCRAVPSTLEGRPVLEITGYPLGVSTDRIVQSIADRARWPEPRRGGGGELVAEVQDRSSGRVGVRILVLLREDAGLAAAEAWLRSVWPATVEVDWCLPLPMGDRLRRAAAAGRTDGLDELRALL